MFEKYMIVEKETSNAVENGKVTGFKVGARIPYYRGLGISMIENVQVRVDGEEVPAERLRVELHGHSYTLKEMETEADDRWEFGEVGFVKVDQPGGLPKGQHKIDLSINLRISYLPMNVVRTDSKLLNF